MYELHFANIHSYKYLLNAFSALVVNTKDNVSNKLGDNFTKILLGFIKQL